MSELIGRGACLGGEQGRMRDLTTHVANSREEGVGQRATRRTNTDDMNNALERGNRAALALVTL
jgi:hypothetical protein